MMNGSYPPRLANSVGRTVASPQFVAGRLAGRFIQCRPVISIARLATHTAPLNEPAQ